MVGIVGYACYAEFFMFNGFELIVLIFVNSIAAGEWVIFHIATGKSLCRIKLHRFWKIHVLGTLHRRRKSKVDYQKVKSAISRIEVGESGKAFLSVITFSS